MTHPVSPRCAGLMLAAVLALLTLAARPLCAEVRVGYIDSARIFTEYKTAQEVQAQFDRQVQGWREDAAERARQVNQLRTEVRDQSPILSAVRRQEKEEALQKAISDYERFIQEIWGPQGRAAQENERVTGEVVQQIRAAVEKVAGAKGLNLVLDVASGVVVYADKTLDLTPEVLTELQARAQGATSH